MFTVHVAEWLAEGVIASHPLVLLAKIFPSIAIVVCLTTSGTAEPLANVAGGQTTVSSRWPIEQENPFGPVTVPA